MAYSSFTPFIESESRIFVDKNANGILLIRKADQKLNL